MNPRSAEGNNIQAPNPRSSAFASALCFQLVFVVSAAAWLSHRLMFHRQSHSCDFRLPACGFIHKRRLNDD